MNNKKLLFFLSLFTFGCIHQMAFSMDSTDTIEENAPENQSTQQAYRTFEKCIQHSKKVLKDNGFASKARGIEYGHLSDDSGNLIALDQLSVDNLQKMSEDFWLALMSNNLSSFLCPTNFEKEDYKYVRIRFNTDHQDNQINVNDTNQVFLRAINSKELYNIKALLNPKREKIRSEVTQYAGGLAGNAISQSTEVITSHLYAVLWHLLKDFSTVSIPLDLVRQKLNPKYHIVKNIHAENNVASFISLFQQECIINEKKWHDKLKKEYGG